MLSTPEINLLASRSPQIGYGRLGIDLSAALERAGVTVYDDLPGVHEGHRSHLSVGTSSGVAKNVCWVTTPSHATGWWTNQRSSLLTMWEATRLPESFFATLPQFETVIVPSAHNHELFSEYHPNVKVAYLGFDQARWQFRERQAPDREFRFLIGGSGKRKGCDLAVDAFRKAFPVGSWGDGPTPVLQMKSPKGGYPYNRIEVIGGRISPEDEVNLYANAHVYLQPSRGEGFGLQPLQAIAQGCPTILTDAHGHKAFSHLGMPLSTTMEPASYFIYGDAGNWWLPSVDDMVDWMHYCYENYDVACADAKVNSDVAHEQFTWDRTATAFVDALGGPDALRAPLGERGDWKAIHQTLFKVVTTKDWKADIVGVEHFFKAGEEYWETSDVKRVMFEADLLDGSCVGAMDGLTEEQVGRYELNRSQYERCQHCGHQMNCKACG